MSDRGFIEVRNFAKFQHYKKRNPPWIKLYGDLLGDPAFFMLNETARFHLIGLFILASKHENRIPFINEWITAELRTSAPIDFDALIASGFIAECAQSASKPRAKRKQKPIAETETEDSSTKNPEREKKAPPPALKYGDYGNVRMTEDEHRRGTYRLKEVKL